MSANTDLEEAIMQAWQTENDIDAVFQGSDVDLSKPENIDRLHNQLVGLKELHSFRMNKLWESFEAMLASHRDNS